MQFFIADDLAKAAADRTLESTELTISASDVSRLQIQLNDRGLIATKQSQGRLRFTMPPVALGNNRLDIRMHPVSPQTTCRVTEVDFTIRYR